MKKLNIVALYKHNIVYKNVRKNNIKMFAVSIACMLVGIISLMILNINNSGTVMTVNPINELYRDVQVATFVNGENVNFILPVKSDKVENLNSSIKINVGDSIMVIAPANGEIMEVGEGQNKYIKIKHSNNLYSVVGGVNICGVKQGQLVKQGKEIATAKSGSCVEISLYENGKQVSGLYVYKSYIKWD